MTHRHLTAAAALTACTALFLTGCGSGDGGNSSDEIAGADMAEKSSAPSATPSGDADRPELDLPKDIKYVFEDGKTGDAEKDAALADNEQFMKAVDMAITLSDPDHRAYQFYAAGAPATAARDQIQRFVDHEASITGSYRFYDRKVTEVKSGAMAITFCEDQGKAYNKSLKTGKADVTPITKNSYVRYSGLMKKSTEGVWVTHELTGERGAEECQP